MILTEVIERWEVSENRWYQTTSNHIVQLQRDISSCMITPCFSIMYEDIFGYLGWTSTNFFEIEKHRSRRLYVISFLPWTKQKRCPESDQNRENEDKKRHEKAKEKSFEEENFARALPPPESTKPCNTVLGDEAVRPPSLTSQLPASWYSESPDGQSRSITRSVHTWLSTSTKSNSRNLDEICKSQQIEEERHRF